MSIKLALLKSGETVISDIKELVSDDKICGYLFKNPHVVGYRTQFLTEEKDSTSNNLEVSLTPWIIFSKDDRMPVPTDWIVTVVEPVTSLTELYEEKVNEQSNQTDSSNEQRNLSE
tara:strand:+ start:64 stop:411 length:348 start_codon:yes stop_codon:yes gene_type:complete